MDDYPLWTFYPTSSRPPDWVQPLVDLVSGSRNAIDSRVVDGLTSNSVLASLSGGLEKLGYQVETGKKRDQRIRRPVLFGDQGKERVAYEIDAVNDELGIVVEVEAGRGAQSNAVYRDLVRSSLIVGADYLVLGVMLAYRHKSGGRPMSVDSYAQTKDQLDAIFASGRLSLPFRGIFLFGY